MRTTITIDDALCQQALELSDHDMPKDALIQEALKTLIQVPASKRFAALGGAQPAMAATPVAATHRHHAYPDR
ncbi:MAG: type II toxin-antitoxin system VapB family antitoxin [Zoogloeaceae bacterium]|nr:type II toxin-antitoxin system VapB family antitoxin [Zoogloeaceae bacterium]